MVSSTPSNTEEPLLPSFDARLFEPPSWATDPVHAGMNGDNGKSKGQSKSKSKSKSNGDEPSGPSDEEGETGSNTGSEPPAGVEEDSEGGVRFTTPELKNLVSLAEKLKAEGNAHFTAKPQRVEEAKNAYLAAIARLPDVSGEGSGTGTAAVTGARIVDLDEEEREDVCARIRACSMATWGNLGAVYTITGEHKEVVEACTKALEHDPKYVKALQRRAAANESIGTWTSLTAAQDDYTALVSILPSNSPLRVSAQRSLAQLPARIAAQQDKEKDEMLGKLKDLGNGLLGKFGLSTDMFKFDEQPGGGYNLRFEK